LFDEADLAIELEHIEEAKDVLNKIARHEKQPSQEMRMLHRYGNLLTNMNAQTNMNTLNQAYEYYDMALDVAEDHNDIDSQIELTWLTGLMRYGDLRFQEALAHYQEALDLWHERAKQLAHPSIEPEVKLRADIGVQYWSIGEFDEAQGTLARALVIAMNRRREHRSNDLCREMASALWTLILVFRSQSDMLDGDANYLRTALRRSKTATQLFKSVSTPDVNMARFYVQVAEVYLDLAELHLQRGSHSAARQMRHEGFMLATQASEFLSPTNDTAAKLLAELTLVRHSIQGQSTRAAVKTMRDIEAWLTSIEQTAADIRDHLVSAKAATVRAEWLLSFGDAAMARQALMLALQGFNQGGMGMATRAQRLLRRITLQGA